MNLDVMDCAYKGSQERPLEPKKVTNGQKSKKLKNLTGLSGSKGSIYSRETKKGGTGLLCDGTTIMLETASVYFFQFLYF